MDEDIRGIVSDSAREFLTDSNEALRFRMVRTSSDLDDEDFFSPEMTHQIYGDGEQIFGYKDLKLSLYISAGRLNMYCHKECEEEVKEEKPDDIITPLASLLPPNTLLDNRQTFLAMLKKENSFKPFGEMMWKHEAKEHDRTFEIYYCDHSTPGFIDYFERVQMFVMFYVDAASYIDIDDARWKFFLVYEKYQIDGTAMYAFCGFTTVYEFYGFPEHVRPRISQMLVLPPFQKKGLGTSMLQAVYTRYKGDSKALTISVEDPSADFKRMRLLVDCKNCMELAAFQPSNLRRGLNKSHYEAAKDKLKLNKECVQAIFNVLRLRITDRRKKSEYYNYRVYIKNQLYAPFRRQDKEAGKLAKCNLSTEEIHETLGFVPKDKRPELIQQEYMDLERKMMDIVLKLPKYP